MANNSRKESIPQHLGWDQKGAVVIKTELNHTFSIHSATEIYDHNGFRNVPKFIREMEKYKYITGNQDHLQQSIYELENATLIINKSSVEVH